jgi:hypothetical protein
MPRIPFDCLGDLSEEMMEETLEWDLLDLGDLASSMLRFSGRAFSIFFGDEFCRCGAGGGTGPAFCN